MLMSIVTTLWIASTVRAMKHDVRISTILTRIPQLHAWKLQMKLYRQRDSLWHREVERFGITAPGEINCSHRLLCSGCNGEKYFVMH
jgi:hypothetical protein